MKAEKSFKESFATSKEAHAYVAERCLTKIIATGGSPIGYNDGTFFKEENTKFKQSCEAYGLLHKHGKTYKAHGNNSLVFPLKVD